MLYYLLTNTEFTCRKNPNDNSFRHANNPGGWVNYPALGPLDNLTFEGLKALKLTVVFSCGTVDDPLDRYINSVVEDLEPYFDRRFGQRNESDEDSEKEQDEKIEEESDKEEDEDVEFDVNENEV